MSTAKIKVTFINHEGTGFAEELEVDDGSTTSQLFAKQMGSDAVAKSYTIRVNRQPVSAVEVLKNGDRMTVTPAKIQGA